MTKEELKAFCKEFNGTQILWKNGDLEFESIILLDAEKGYSIKPIDSPEEVTNKIIDVWGKVPKNSGIKPDNPKFCLSHGGKGTIEAEMKSLKKRIESGLYDTTLLDGWGTPICNM